KNGKLYKLQEIADIAGTTHSTMYLATENGDLKTKKIKRAGKGSPFCSSMSPAYVKKALAILLDRGYVQELVNGAFFEAIPDDQRHRPNPLLGETDGARCRCGVASACHARGIGGIG
ncbi:MAG: hypothetical protein KDD89_00345, partial [Anaerolineales bacterium]|nr:hypothetical protein [Anaerolineales bacterium]